MRARWLAVGLIGVIGCRTLLEPVEQPPPDPLPAAERGHQTAPLAPPLPAGEGVGGRGLDEPDHLTLAADALARDDRPAAATHLTAYVRAHPDQPMFRAQLAELLFRLGRHPDARAEFERFVADADGAGGTVGGHRVHCHTRLMLIGRAAGDRFAERFHRGAGLLLLAAALGDDPAAEPALCQALDALTEAKGVRPADPRVHVYLGDAYEMTGNRRAAEVARATARNLAGPGDLTPAEFARLGPR